jgi:hypothetical protein
VLAVAEAHELPAHVVVYLLMALCLYADDDYEEAAAKLTGMLSCLPGSRWQAPPGVRSPGAAEVRPGEGGVRPGPRGCYMPSSCLRKIFEVRSAAVGAFEDLEELSADGSLEAALCVAGGLPSAILRAT